MLRSIRAPDTSYGRLKCPRVSGFVPALGRHVRERTRGRGKEGSRGGAGAVRMCVCVCVNVCV